MPAMMPAGVPIPWRLVKAMRALWPAAVLLVLVLPALRVPAVWAAPPGLEARLAPLIDRGGVAVGRDGEPDFVLNPGAYIPASTIKLATALAALHHLGPDYRFRTPVYRDAEGNLYVQGRGDPFLISETWEALASELAAAGVFAEPLQALVLDVSAIAPDQVPDGAGDSLNPYDAQLGALVSNFNTAYLRVAPDGAVRSAEPQTPLTAVARQAAQGLAPGEHRINLSAINPAHSLRYSGELARSFFEAAGARFVEGAGRVRQGRVPAGLEPVWVHRSARTLSETIQAMLQFSNNYIANQIVLTLALESGGLEGGTPATLEAGMAPLRDYLHQVLGLRPEEVALVEGSGLSRQNHITLRAMLRVVDAFHPWQHLLKPYRARGFTVPAKTGTLTGVISLAGFLPAPPGERRPFVLFLEQRRNTRGAIVQALHRAYAP